uniref:L-type lectin-like domain-containing protein n=1 Tax=Leptobrachium leishanense TaxID=445787 RepID=A0A8C5WCE8_9ANUR
MGEFFWFGYFDLEFSILQSFSWFSPLSEYPCISSFSWEYAGVLRLPCVLQPVTRCLVCSLLSFLLSALQALSVSHFYKHQPPVNTFSMSSLRRLLLLFLLLPLLLHSEEPAHRTFEYKYSFKGPHITLPDGNVPFWDLYGDTIPGPDAIRIVPSLKKHRGSMWTQLNASFPHWEVEVSLRIMGHGQEGTEGLAIWFTREPGRVGTVYGSTDQWDGVGIIFDTFDHDFKGNNPAILIVGNNGKLNYDHAQDGISQALGSCVVNFRNTVRPFRAKISYYKKTLRVIVYNGRSPLDDSFEICTQVANMVIPSTGYFGLSAATGNLADDHDVFSFMMYSLSKTWEESPSAQIPDDEKEKLLKEFEEFQKEYEKNMREFEKNHPTLGDDSFDSDSQRELDMVLAGQGRLLEELSVLNKRLNMTLVEQRRNRDILSQSGSNETTTVKQDHVHNVLETVMNGIPDLLAMTKDLKQDVLKMATKAKEASRSQGKGSGSISSSNITDVQQDFMKIKRNLQSLVKNSANKPCPSGDVQHSCLSSSLFLTFLLLQTVCSVIYMLFGGKGDSATKKFY